MPLGPFPYDCLLQHAQRKVLSLTGMARRGVYDVEAMQAVALPVHGRHTQSARDIHRESRSGGETHQRRRERVDCPHSPAVCVDSSSVAARLPDCDTSRRRQSANGGVPLSSQCA